MYEDREQGVYSGYQPYQPAQQGAGGSGYGAGAPNGKDPKKGGFWKRAAVAAAFGIFFGVSAGAGFYAVRFAAAQARHLEGVMIQDAEEIGEKEEAVSAPESTPEAAGNTAQAAASVQNVSATVVDVSDVVDRVMPAMVSITKNSIYTGRDFFGQAIQQEQVVSGSGIIVGKSDTELLIATNNHVVEDATRLSVQFQDGQESEAQVKGTDSTKDLAVIAVALDEIPQETQGSLAIAQMGDSDALRVGEGVIAVGNAMGYGQSVTTGVISAVGREREVEGVSGTFIQTDAAINPGNSGGALLNMRGEVIGINSNKIGSTVVEGMGYAIPISSARPIIEDLMTKTTRRQVEEEEQGFLGISGVNVTSDVADTYNMPQGVMVTQVYDNTGAQKAGIVKGNIITRFDGSAVSTMEELKGMLQYYAAGTTVDVTVMEGSPDGWTEKTIEVTLGKQQNSLQ